MSILSAIGSVLNIKAAGGKLDKKDTAKETKETTKEPETSYSSKEANEAVLSNARAEIEAKKEPRIRACSTSISTGELFPDFDQKEITQDYLKLRQEARQKAVQTARKLHNVFEKGDMSDILDKNGNIIATFSYPEKKEGEFDSDSDFYSFKMTEYDPKTKEVVAITKVFNHMSNNSTWKKQASPYMERIEFGKRPEDTTYLKVTYTGKEKDGKYILYSTIQTYAKGYQTDGKATGIRKADKFYSSLIHNDYESYRTNYEAPARIFDGCLYAAPASITERGGMEGEKFDSALEYPLKQFKIGDELFIFNPYYVNEEGNRKKED